MRRTLFVSRPHDGQEARRTELLRPTRTVLAATAIFVGGIAISCLQWQNAANRLPGAYLAAVMFATTITMGALALGAVLTLAGASWAVPWRRVHEATSGALPLIAVLVLPLLLAPAAFYPWARDELPEGAGLIENRNFFAHGPFAIRTALELAVLIGLEELVRRSSLKNPPQRVARGWAAASLLAVAFVGSLTVLDLFMSANGSWSSDLYGLYALIGGFSGAVGALAVAASELSGELRTGPAHAHALGRTLLTAIALWGYLAFVLFLLVWIADLPSEVGFYTSRSEGPWRALFVTLAFGHFIVPLLLLLPRSPKRRLGYVAAVGALVVSMCAIDSYWLVMPATASTPSPLDTGPLLAVGGLATLLAIHRFRRHAPLPTEDPSLAGALAYEAR